MADRWNSLSDWFSDWAADIHPYVYLRSLEITDATAALFTKERMNMILFDSPTILHVPVTYYSDYKRRLIADGTFWYVMITIHFLHGHTFDDLGPL